MNYLRELAPVLSALVVLVGGLYAAAVYVIAPRLVRTIDTTIAPVVQRVAALEVGAIETRAHVDGVIEWQARAENSLGGLGAEIRDGIRELASSIRDLAEKHATTAEEVAEIRGRLSAPTPRRRRKGGT